MSLAATSQASAIVSTTKLSSKGQVVIPEDVRKSLKLKAGVQFVVMAKGDTVVLKTITPPSREEFSQMLDEVQRQARAAKLKKSDLARIIQEVREGK